ncbi:MAG: HD domain-containing protein [Treponema sp.]|jgi:exopolyphosphatase/guanosine-5'-triphosphate,3'-diphosphate pyrophosphatase|nr:HD domain-containing protein [Treponema sp.]
MENSSRLVAILEIGSTGIRALVAEMYGAGEWKFLDRAGKPVALGRDVFTSRQVGRESLLECLTVLQSFRELLDGWGIADEDIHCIATSALRAAKNRDVFVDRVRHETGFNFSVVEGIEENRLMYLAVRFAIKNDLPLFWRSNSMIIDVGGGSTEIMLLRRGKMVAAHSINLGTILIDRQARLALGAARFQERYLNENIRNTSEFLNAEMALSYVRTFVIAGADARMMAALIGRELNKDCWVIARKEFAEFVEEIRNYSVEDTVQKLHVPFADAEGFVPGILVYKHFLDRTNAVQVAVPLVSIREGLLIDLASGVDPGLQDEFFSQVIASAVNLGRKYHFDEPHHRHVARLCMTLFDALVREHGMNRRERMMLEVAATLHDIGMFIKGSGHQQHGQYIVANSEIFGLRSEELIVIAKVIRYHRGDLPAFTDIDYLALQKDEQILMLKMASILRVADALDRGHSQHIRSITVEKKSEAIFVYAQGTHELSLEQIGLEEKGDLFQDIFGYKVILN